MAEDGRRTTSVAMRTYRCVRVGMISSVVLLEASVVEERTDGDRWETSWTPTGTRRPNRFRDIDQGTPVGLP